jgi:NAD(P)-dependent dehydrogenase (short-subunit alcohol dehydrogenase family)
MGRASAELFVREGAKVLEVDVSGRQNDTAAALGESVVAFQRDVAKEWKRGLQDWSPMASCRFTDSFQE